MRVTEWRHWLVFTAAFLVAAGVGNCAKGEDNDTPVRVSLCEVLAHPAEYSGKSLIITVRITSTKEGSSLWHPSCRKVGVALQFDASATSGQGIADLREVLRLHGLSNYPVIATLTGVFIYDQYDEVRHRRRSVFKATAATDIKQSHDVEHR
jgi:hypothetical protein